MFKQNLKVLALFLAILGVSAAFYFISLSTVNALKP